MNPSIPGPDHTAGHFSCKQFSREWWFISLTLLALLSIVPIGALATAFYILCCGLMALARPISTGRALLRYLPLFLYPGLCLLSTQWSDAPDVTLKQSLELIATTVTVVVIFNRIAGRELASALLGPSFIICVLCLLAQPSALRG